MERSSYNCPHCGAIVSVKSLSCDRCGNPLPYYGSSESRRDSSQIRDTSPVVTKSFQLVYVVLFIGTVIYAIKSGGSPVEAFAPGHEYSVAMIGLGSLAPALVIVNGEWYRLFTATLLHFGVIHLLFNAGALGAVGPEIERYLGRWRFFILMVLTGILGNLGSLLWMFASYTFSPTDGAFVQSAGASGAICGLCGALYDIGRRRGGESGRFLQGLVRRWVVLNVIIGLLIPGIDNAAHFSGIVAGLALTPLLDRRRPARRL